MLRSRLILFQIKKKKTKLNEAGQEAGFCSLRAYILHSILEPVMLPIYLMVRASQHNRSIIVHYKSDRIPIFKN